MSAASNLLSRIFRQLVCVGGGGAAAAAALSLFFFVVSGGWCFFFLFCRGRSGVVAAIFVRGPPIFFFPAVTITWLRDPVCWHPSKP